MKQLLITLLALVLCPPAQAFWWSLTDEEQQICESRAANKMNDFAAKQAFERCQKGIRAELKEREERRAKAQAEQEAAEAKEAAKEAAIIKAVKQLTPGIEKRFLA